MSSPLNTLRERLEHDMVMRARMEGVEFIALHEAVRILDAFLAEWRCDTCIDGDVATIDGHYAQEPCVHCTRHMLWKVSDEFCSMWEARA